MSSWLAATIGVVAIKRKPDPIAPFKRTVELAEAEQQKAIKELEAATEKLIQVVAEKLPK